MLNVMWTVLLVEACQDVDVAAGVGVNVTVNPPVLDADTEDEDEDDCGGAGGGGGGGSVCEAPLPDGAETEGERKSHAAPMTIAMMTTMMTMSMPENFRVFLEKIGLI